METKILNLSATQINMFLRCQYQWYLRYVENLKIPPKAEMAVGKAFHKTFEKNFKFKIESKSDLPVKDIMDIFDQEFTTEIQEVEDKNETDIGKLKDSGYLIVKEYREKKAEDVNPIEVEKYLTYKVSDNVIIEGYADIVTEENTVIDLKTTKKTPSEIDLSYQLQLETYALAGNFSKAEVHYAVQTKTPKIISLEHSLPENKRIPLIASQIAKSIETGIFLPNGLGHSWACQYCGYKEKNLCPYSK